MTQGYITLATGDHAYYDMAENLAASVKVMDPGRPIALVHDHDAVLSPTARRLFDYLIPLPPDPRYVTVVNKFKLFELSPFEETMFVDADCLLVKNDIDHYWSVGRERFFTIPGQRRTTGTWKGKHIPAILAQESVPYIVEVNAGVFIFDKSDTTRTFFEGLNRFFLERREALAVNTHNGRRKFSDEMFLSVFLAREGIDAWDRSEALTESWMCTTYRSIVLHIDPKRSESLVLKPTGHLFDVPFLPTRVVRISPTFAHFVGLKPAHVYNRLSAQFREEALARLATAPQPAADPASVSQTA